MQVSVSIGQYHICAQHLRAITGYNPKTDCCTRTDSFFAQIGAHQYGALNIYVEMAGGLYMHTLIHRISNTCVVSTKRQRSYSLQSGDMHLANHW